MEKKAKQFLSDFSAHLRSMPKVEREDAVMEIQSHIADCTASGKSVEAALADLGDPKKLAKAYLAEYHLDSVTTKRKGLNIFKSSLFFATTGFLSIFIVSVLGFITLVFGWFTFLMPVYGVMRTFGAKNVLILWNDVQVPAALGIPAGVLLGFLCGAVVWGLMRIMIGYFKYVARGYHALLPELSAKRAQNL